MDIFNRVEKIFKIVFENDELTIKESDDSNTIAGWDSLRHINLLSMLESEFEIEFEIDQVVEMENIGDIIKAIKENLN